MSRVGRPGRPVSYLTSEAVAAAGAVNSPWFRVFEGVDAGDAALARKAEAYPYLFLRGYLAVPVSSAADGLQLQISYDRVTILTPSVTTITVAAPGTLEAFNFSLASHSGKFIRVRYVNGAIALGVNRWLLQCWMEELA